MRRFAAVVGATVLAAGLFVVTAPAAGAQTTTFGPGVNDTFPVPAGVCQVTIAAWGGSGGDGNQGIGGGSGRIQADFTVNPGDVLTVTVASGETGFNDGGNNGSGGGEGGGSSAVVLGVPLIIAAGGGGGGLEGLAGTGNGGDGGHGQNPGSPGDDGITGGGGGAGGSFNGTPGDGGDAGAFGGGGGAGAAPGDAGADDGGGGGGGGGGNSVSSSATNVTDPGSLQGPGGEVRITEGPGCATDDDDDDDDDERTAAPVAQPISATPAFTG